MAKKGGGKQTTEVRIDPQTRQYVEQTMRPQAQELADLYRNYGGSFFPGVSDLTRTAEQQLMDQWGQAGIWSGTGYGLLGQGAAGAAQTGAQGIGGYMSPFIQNVLGAQNAQFDLLRQQALNFGRQEATRAGAYGGNRGEVLQAEMVNPLNMQQATTSAQLLNQGWNTGLANMQQDRSRQLALGQLGAQVGMGGLGMGAGISGQLAGLGDYYRQVGLQQAQEPVYRGQLAQQALASGLGPYGQTQTTAMPSNKFGSMLAGGAIGSQFGPWGALAGAGGGLLGSWL